ncbi:MAG: peptidoglycan DD-metalloendopeptidase family protein [Deltaproteobacteria bacterium]|nr:peptidoglycan DD-metalloendopeptidase family protein [Deltaproteobacteria bacterium]
MHSLAWAVIIILFPCLAFASDDPPQIRKLSEKVKAVEGKYRNEEKKLYDMDQEIFRIQDRISLVRKDIELKQDLSAGLEKDLEHYQTVLKGHEEKLRNNWIGLYKGSFFDIIDIYYSHLEYTGYLNSVLKHNNEVLKEYQELRSTIAQARARLEEVALGLKKDLTDLEDTVEELHEEREKKAKMLASLKRESEDYQDRMKELLNRMEEDKRQKELVSASIFKKKGRLPWPVLGKIVRKFGTFHVKGVAQSSRGIDIEADEGAPVRSIYEGKVVFVNWINVYGNTVIIDHGGGYYSVYGHLQKVVASVGDRISARENIAEVGQSGDVVRPMLHFELRFRDKPQDPQGWLVSQ